MGHPSTERLPRLLGYRAKHRPGSPPSLPGTLAVRRGAGRPRSRQVCGKEPRCFFSLLHLRRHRPGRRSSPQPPDSAPLRPSDELKIITHPGLRFPGPAGPPGAAQAEGPQAGEPHHHHRRRLPVPPPKRGRPQTTGGGTVGRGKDGEKDKPSPRRTPASGREVNGSDARQGRTLSPGGRRRDTLRLFLTRRGPRPRSPAAGPTGGPCPALSSSPPPLKPGPDAGKSFTLLTRRSPEGRARPCANTLADTPPPPPHRLLQTRPLLRGHTPRRERPVARHGIAPHLASPPTHGALEWAYTAAQETPARRRRRRRKRPPLLPHTRRCPELTGGRAGPWAL